MIWKVKGLCALKMATTGFCMMPWHRKKHTFVNDGFVRLPADTWKGAGVAIPVFSLRSAASFGVGEFTDLKRLADWAKRARLETHPDSPGQRHQRDAYLDGLVSLRRDFGLCAASALPESQRSHRRQKKEPAQDFGGRAETAQRTGRRGLRGGDVGQVKICP